MDQGEEIRVDAHREIARRGIRNSSVRGQTPGQLPGMNNTFSDELFPGQAFGRWVGEHREYSLKNGGGSQFGFHYSDLYIKAEIYDIPILNFIGLAFQSHRALLAGFGIAAANQ